MMYWLRRSAEHFSIKLLVLLTVFYSNNVAYAQDPTHPKRLSFVSYGFGEKGNVGSAYIRKTHRVKAVMGARFGMDYMFLGPAGRDYYYTEVWVYPHPITDARTGETAAQLNIDMHEQGNQKLYAGFILEYPHEIVKGKWSLRFYYKGRMVYKEDFELY